MKFIRILFVSIVIALPCFAADPVASVQTGVKNTERAFKTFQSKFSILLKWFENKSNLTHLFAAGKGGTAQDYTDGLKEATSALSDMSRGIDETMKFLRITVQQQKQKAK